MIWYVVIAVLIGLWSFYTVVQAKMTAAVKKCFRELGKNGDIYFGRSSIGFKFWEPQAVMVISVVNGNVNECRCINIPHLRSSASIEEWQGMIGKHVDDIEQAAVSSQPHIQKAAAELKKNYHKFSKQFHR